MTATDVQPPAAARKKRRKPAPKSPGFEAQFTLSIGGAEAMTVAGGSRGGNCFLEFRQADGSTAIRAEWQEAGIASYLHGQTPGIPMTVTVAEEEHEVYCRDADLYDRQTQEPWRPADAPWSEDFVVPFVSPLPGMDDDPVDATETRTYNVGDGFEDWVSCMSGFSSAGGGIGAVVGGFMGGGNPAAFGSGAAIGAAAGASFGAGYCTADAVDKAVNRRRALSLDDDKPIRQGNDGPRLNPALLLRLDRIPPVLPPWILRELAG